MDGALATHQTDQLLTKKYDKLELPGRLIAERTFYPNQYPVIITMSLLVHSELIRQSRCYFRNKKHPFGFVIS